MRLLFLIDNLGSGGAQRQMTSIATSLNSDTIQVEVLCYHDNRFFLPLLEKYGIQVHWILIKNPIIRIFRIRSFIRKRKYDAVISFMDVPDLLNCLSAIGKHSWKVITSERSANENNFALLKYQIIARVKEISDVIVCNSENAQKMWLKYYPQYKNKIRVIYNLVHLSYIQDEYILRRNNKTHIVIAASFQAIKNPIRVVKAVSLLEEEEKKKIKIDWYGKQNVSGSGRRVFEETQQFIRQNNLSDVFHLNEETSNIYSYMYQADVIGLFSEFEGLPNTICEAMLLAKPIVMTKVSDYETLVNKNNGVLCEWDNVLSIKEALSKILSLTNDDLKNMGMCSKAKALSLFDKKLIINQWKELL